VAVDTIVTYRNDEKSPMKYRIIMSADGSIGELKRLLSAKCGLLTPKVVQFFFFEYISKSNFSSDVSI
jgi:hypothetical protein